MNETLAIEVLYAAVQARFTADGTALQHVFGWREPAQHVYDAANTRIVWVPGDPSGALGTIGGARQPGRRPNRPLATLNELFTVWINGVDPTDPENELKQYHATRLVYDAWYRAVYLAAHGTFQVRAQSWLTDQKERRYGCALRVVVELQAMIPDAVRLIAPVDVAADITVVLSDATAIIEVAADGGNVTTGEPGGSSNVGTATVFKAGEPLSALRVVRLKALTSDTLVYCRPPEPEALAPLGITAAAAGTGNTIAVVTDGGEIHDPSWAWIVGRPVLLGLSGTLTQTESLEVGYALAIGVAIATDTIAVRIEPAIFLAA